MKTCRKKVKGEEINRQSDSKRKKHYIDEQKKRKKESTSKETVRGG